MGDAQKIKAEHDIEARRQVIKAEIDALMEKYPQLKYTDERATQPDHGSGAAAQNACSHIYPNFQGITTASKGVQWKPKLHPTPLQSSDAIGPDRAGGVGSSAREKDDDDTYLKIFHNKACNEILYLGGHT